MNPPVSDCFRADIYAHAIGFQVARKRWLPKVIIRLLQFKWLPDYP